MILKMLIGAVVILFLIMLTVFVIVLLNSKGTIDPVTNDNKGLSEKVFVTIGGVKQGMIIRSKNIDKPVLLYLHGGPAFPNYFLIDKYNSGLEEFFTVCYWEQRGGGLSYTPEVTLESMNFEQLTSDAIDVTNYLRKRFDKQKIYLMAHSGGTPIGLMAASQAPQLFEAYIGMAQITNQTESEKLAYTYMIEQFALLNNRKALKKLKAYPLLESDSMVVPFYKSMERDTYMHKLGIGTMRNMQSVFSGVFIPVWMCNAYTFSEKINIWKSKFTFVKNTRLIDELFQSDFSTAITKLEVPVYFFSGAHDLTVNNNLSKAYLEKLQAPVKGYYTFENSAHSPIFEEPEKFQLIIEQDVLKDTITLADSN